LASTPIIGSDHIAQISAMMKKPNANHRFHESSITRSTRRYCSVNH